MKEQPKMHFEPKGWGFERWIVNKPEYCGKLLFIAKDRRCSLHYHKRKDEVFYLQSGKILVYYHDDLRELKKAIAQYGRHQDFCEALTLKPGDNFHVPPGRIHQMVALTDSQLFEFSTQHFEEDSYRLIRGD